MRYRLVVLLLAALAASVAGAADAPASEYRVTVRNTSQEQTLLGIFVMSHGHGAALFEIGKPAGDELARLAEGGDAQALADYIVNHPKVLDVAVHGEPLGPGAAVTLTLRANPRADRLSFAAMLTPSNDGFVALNGVPASSITPAELSRRRTRPVHGKDRFYKAMLYDAGTETNDEVCASMPGPLCGGAGPSPDDGGEGQVAVHPGVQGVGDLGATRRGWGAGLATVLIEQR